MHSHDSCHLEAKTTSEKVRFGSGSWSCALVSQSNCAMTQCSESILENTAAVEVQLSVCVHQRRRVCWPHCTHTGLSQSVVSWRGHQLFGSVVATRCGCTVAVCGKNSRQTSSKKGSSQWLRRCCCAAAAAAAFPGVPWLTLIQSVSQSWWGAAGASVASAMLLELGNNTFLLPKPHTESEETHQKKVMLGDRGEERKWREGMIEAEGETHTLIDEWVRTTD